MAAVLALDVPITLVGLDATNDVPVPADIVDQLVADHAAAGADIAYEMYARTPFLAAGGNSYWDPLAAVTLTDPSVAGWEDITVAMQPTGPAAGRLVARPGRPAGPGRDVRRPRRLHGRVPRRAADRRAAGEPVHHRRVDGGPLGRHLVHGTVDQPETAGLVEVTLVNTTQRDVALLMGGTSRRRPGPTP